MTPTPLAESQLCENFRPFPFTKKKKATHKTAAKEKSMPEKSPMERQRSFSLKSTLILTLFALIASSLLIFFSFSFWIFSLTPLIRHETHLHFNATATASFDLFTVENQSGLVDGSLNSAADAGWSSKDSILVGAHFEDRGNVTASVEWTVLEEVPEGEEDDDDEVQEGKADDALSTKDTVTEESGEEGGKGGSVGAVKELRRAVDAVSAKGTVTEESGEEGGKGGRVGAEKELRRADDAVSAKDTVIEESGEEVGKGGRFGAEKEFRRCDLMNGRWVYDESYPFYTNSTCPYIDEGFDCVGNGRKDKSYMKWRWRPHVCELPRFNATSMLEMMRGKRVVFVGDSINRNQWESLLCMLLGGVRDPSRVYETRGRKIAKERGNYCFRFVDYRCTVEFYVTHFLVHEGQARIGRKRVQTLRIDRIDHGSSRWRGADIVVFNTGSWWSHYKTKAGINYYQEGSVVHPQLDVSAAFRKALTTWASWVDSRINPRKTRVFFRSLSPAHFRGGQWNSGGHCGEATQPLDFLSSKEYHEKNSIVQDVIRRMRVPVHFLDITGLSEYRIDGHPSIYSGGKSSRHRSQTVQDCSHWCLPGVPDTWNELLYVHLLNS